MIWVAVFVVGADVFVGLLWAWRLRRWLTK
jgi:hypothetical protein